MTKVNILIIEPDFALAKTYADYLSRDYEVRYCTNAQAAIDASDELTPDLIVLEIQLSAHSGWEFIYELKSYGEWKDIPIILQTIVPQHALNLSEPRMQQFNIKEYLYKPATNLKKLKFSIDRHLSVVGNEADQH